MKFYGRWARDQKTGTPATKAVLLTLATYADERGFCFPSQERLAIDTELTDRTVRTALARLELLGLIERHERRSHQSKRFKTDLIELRPPETISAGPRRATGNSRHEPPETISAGSVDEPPEIISAKLPLKDSPEGKSRGGVGDPSNFDRFWQAWPEKIGRKDAERAWRHLDEPDLDPILAGVARYVAMKPKGQRYMNAAKWIAGERWNDELAPEPLEPARSNKQRSPWADFALEASDEEAAVQEARRATQGATYDEPRPEKRQLTVEPADLAASRNRPGAAPAVQPARPRGNGHDHFRRRHN
jgi:hypothetical protein